MDRLENLMDIEQIDAPENSDDEDDEDEKPSEELVKLVASQANVTDREAEKALMAENNEVVNAIMVRETFHNILNGFDICLHLIAFDN
jgi:NACalpha-BTF3-like transcription factor